MLTHCCNESHDVITAIQTLLKKRRYILYARIGDTLCITPRNAGKYNGTGIILYNIMQYILHYYAAILYYIILCCDIILYNIMLRYYII